MRPIWIDTDIALGSSPRGPNRDVDDGWAIAALVRLAAETGYTINGISICDGNADAANALVCLRQLLAQMNANVAQIAPQPKAAQQIATLPAGCTLIALGPLTNIAAALRIDPALPNRVALTMVGGVLNRWNIRRRLSDLNIHRDPAAASTVMAAFENCRQCPLDVVDNLLMNAKIMRRIQASSQLGKYLATHSTRWLRSARWRHMRGAFPVWDLVAALAAVDALPSARYDAKNRLIEFNVAATWAQVEALLAR